MPVVTAHVAPAGAGAPAPAPAPAGASKAYACLKQLRQGHWSASAWPVDVSFHAQSAYSRHAHIPIAYA